MKKVCAWCGKPLGDIDGKGVEGVSHGMCEECYKKQFPEMDMPASYALAVRAELRKLPTEKLQEDYETLKHDPEKATQVSAIREILWERGVMPSKK